MFFFKPRPPAPEFEPDTTRVRLYNGAWAPYDEEPAPYRVYTLRDWDGDWDVEFSEVAMDCALAILDEYEFVVNRLGIIFVEESVRDDEEIMEYVESDPLGDFCHGSNVITVTRGPDRNLVSTIGLHDEEFYIQFYGYRMPPPDNVLRGKPFPPDIRVDFLHLHNRLIIVTEHRIDMFIHKIRDVCGRYGKTVVMEGFPPEELC